MNQAKEMARIAFEALEDKKGEDVQWISHPYPFLQITS